MDSINNSGKKEIPTIRNVK